MKTYSEGMRRQGHSSTEWRRAPTSLPIKALAVAMVLAFAWGCASQTAKPAPESPAGMSPLAEAERAVRDFEALESSGEVYLSAPADMREEKANQMVARLEEANAEVDGYLMDHPGDPTALLLKARVLRALDETTPKVFSSGPDGNLAATGTSHRPEIQKILDAVLAKDPGNASAHYWKARMCALQEPMIDEEEGITYGQVDMEGAVFHAGKAVELAPDKLVYREYYAQALIATGHPEDSMALMKDVSGGNHPIYRLQKDWQLIPLPEGAVVDPVLTMSMIEMLMASGQRGNYPNIRIAAFFVPQSAEEVMALYISRFPVQALEMERVFSVALAWAGEELVQVEAPQGDDPDFSGVMIMITEMSQVPPHKQDMFQIPEGGKACTLLVHNTRQFAR